MLKGQQGSEHEHIHVEVEDDGYEFDVVLAQEVRAEKVEGVHSGHEALLVWEIAQFFIEAMIELGYFLSEVQFFHGEVFEEVLKELKELLLHFSRE